MMEQGPVQCAGWPSGFRVLMDGASRETLDLTGREEFSITGLDNGEADEVTVRADDKEFRARVRLDTPKERDYLRHGGILQYVLRRFLAES